MAACGGSEKKEQENYDDGMNPADRMNAIKVIFMEADKNNDKLISKAEWLKCCQTRDKDKYSKEKAIKEFKLIDKSNSGDISLAELDLFIVEKQLEAVRDRFKKADTSKDRKLDKKEFGTFFSKEGMKKKAIGKLWKKCDKNGDGKVSYSEFSEWMEKEMADGVLRETFSDMFVSDAKKAEEMVRAKGAENQKKRDDANAKAQKEADAEKK